VSGVATGLEQPAVERAAEPRGEPGWAPLAATGAGIAVAGAVCLWTATTVHPGRAVHDCALFVHLASLVVGFGAVLSVDWVALLWVLRRRRLSDVLVTAGNVHVPIWAGYSGLVLSGVLLEPSLGSPITQVKLALVLLIGWNGLVATWLHHVLHGDVRRRLIVVSALSATVSQLGWWGAMAIGFVNGR
jgi:hypothetical protein